MTEAETRSLDNDEPAETIQEFSLEGEYRNSEKDRWKHS